MDSRSPEMVSLRPYIVRAFYEWICDSQLTPFLVVNTEIENVQVPAHLATNGHLTLDISPDAVDDFRILRTRIECLAYFDFGTEPISIPMRAIVAVFAQENEEGIAFSFHEDDDRMLKEEEDAAQEYEEKETQRKNRSVKAPLKPVSTSHLKIVKNTKTQSVGEKTE